MSRPVERTERQVDPDEGRDPEPAPRVERGEESPEKRLLRHLPGEAAADVERVHRPAARERPDEDGAVEPAAHEHTDGITQ